jgi:RimJ/RimL family protein N-acetyltransferase
MKKPTIYKIETQNLIIRCYDPFDSCTLNSIILENREYIGKWMSWTKKTVDSIEDKLNFIRKSRSDFDIDKNYNFAIILKNSNTMIGNIGLYRRSEMYPYDLSYWIDKNQSNKGYMSEAISALVYLSLEYYQFTQIEIRCDENNIASNKVAIKSNLKLEYKLRNFNYENQKIVLNVFVLFQEEYTYTNNKPLLFNLTNEVINI